MPRLKLPFKKQIETLRQLHENFGPRWFTVADAALVLADDYRPLLTDKTAFNAKIRSRLQTLVRQEVLNTMMHPRPRSVRFVRQYQITEDAVKLVNFYALHAEKQQQLDEVFDLL